MKLIGDYFMKKVVLLVSIISVILLGCGTENNQDKEVDNARNDSEQQKLMVSAAASLTDAMDEITEKYEAEHPGIDLEFNFAGSGKLAQQIQQGAPVDVFISANESWMDTLIHDEEIDKSERLDVTGNRLVMITQNDTDIHYESFDEIDGSELDQIAIGNLDSVPAGEYSKEVLDRLEKWDELENQFVYAKDVRQVLTYVESGNADIGFVYESDALSSDNVKIITYADPEAHDDIIYPGAILSGSEVQKEGKKFLEYLISEEGQEILEKHGFSKEDKA